MTIEQLLLCGVIGLLGGIIGGLLGLGGGLLIIPALALLFGPRVHGPQYYHLYQAALMTVYIAVALAATLRNLRSGTVRWDALSGMVPASAVTIVAGVWLSNRFTGINLGRLFALFLVYAILLEIRRLVRSARAWRKQGSGVRGQGSGQSPGAPVPGTAPPNASPPSPDTSPVPRIAFSRGAAVGGVMGFLSGLLGIGGGAVAVPLQQVICGLRLKPAIGTSTAAIAVTGLIGAIVKNATLAETTAGQFGLGESLALAAALLPGAMVGGYLGAALNQRLHTFWVRLVFVILLSLSAAEMSGLLGLFGGQG